MSYFEKTDAMPERIGKVIGDVLALFVACAVLAVDRHLAP
jgi:hypothetical protein